MFQSKVLQGALAALSFLESVIAVFTTRADKLAYPAFDAAMLQAGGFNWASYPVTTESGYKLTMFRIVGDKLGANILETRGPLLFQAGMFSEMLDWLDNTRDPTQMAIPLQMAERGFDVWLSSGRGRQYSDTHTTFGKDDPLTAAQYWNFSFETVGKEDVPAFVDTIVKARPDACNKVSMISHSTGASEALIAAAYAPNFNAKVGAIAAVGPCLLIDGSQNWLGVSDIDSVNFVFSKFIQVPSMFGPDHLTKINSWCAADPVNAQLCDYFLKPNPAETDPSLREQSIAYHRHVYQNAALQRYQPVSDVADPTAADQSKAWDKPTYALETITDIKVYGLAGTADIKCRSAENLSYTEKVPGSVSTNILGFKNSDFLKDNSIAYVTTLSDLMPMAPTPITTSGVCPSRASCLGTIDKKGNCKCDSGDEVCKADQRGQVLPNGGGKDKSLNPKGSDKEGKRQSPATKCDSSCRRQSQFEYLKQLALQYKTGDGLDVNRLNQNLTKVIERMAMKGVAPDMSWMNGTAFESDSRSSKKQAVKPSGTIKLTAEQQRAANDEAKANAELARVQEMIDQLVAGGKGSPRNIMNALQKVIDYMDKMGYQRPDTKYLPGYDFLKIAVFAECKKNKNCEK